MGPRLTALQVVGDLDSWLAAGFAVTGDAVMLGSVAVHVIGPEVSSARPAITAWGFDTTSADRIDGLATFAEAMPAPAASDDHPNGISSIDHVVVMTPTLDRTIDELVEAGFEIRRIRDATIAGTAMRQAFIRAGDTILEIVGPAEPSIEASGTTAASATFWGLAMVAPDLDATVRWFGPDCSPAKAAVQPGRRIATLDTRTLGIGIPIALMSPHAVGS